MVDTAQQSDRRLWEDLAARAIGVPVPYRPAPGIAIYHLSVDDYVVMAAEHDLAGALLDLAGDCRDGTGRRMLERGISVRVKPSKAEGSAELGSR
jgi:hypothetical protein